MSNVDTLLDMGSAVRPSKRENDMTYQIDLRTSTSDGVDLRSVHLPHAPVDPDKIARIAEAMQTKGWQGRPVILVDGGDHAIAITGVHRLCAVINSETEVEAVWIPADLDEAHMAAIIDANDDDDRLAAIIEAAEGRDDMDGIVAAMQAEVEANA